MRFPVLLAFAGVLIASPAAAVRPFITDDARVVGQKKAQLETWARYDRGSFQHWIVPAVGPIAPLEVTLGGTHGAYIDEDPNHSVAAPFVQTKWLLHEARDRHPPGIAWVIGTFFPFGYGGFESPPAAYSYFAFTQMFGEDALLLHANLGLAVAQVQRPARENSAELEKHEQLRATWGVASQARLYGPVNLAAEIFSGDPLAEVGGAAGQGGFRFVMSDSIQLDATAGTGLWGNPRMTAWVSTGFRIVSKELW